MIPNPALRTPQSEGRFGPYGGRYVPETLMFALEQLDRAYREAKADPASKEAYLIERPQYVMSYNDKKKTVNWVCWQLVKKDVGNPKSIELREAAEKLLK